MTTTPLLPAAELNRTMFEGKEVFAVQAVVSGLSKLTPQAPVDQDNFWAIDDLVTGSLHFKVTGIGYETTKEGLLVRVQRIRPVEGVITVDDVLRDNDALRIR